MDNFDKNSEHSQDTDCKANIIYTEQGPLLLRKRKVEITVANEPPPKRPIIQDMADKNKRQTTFLHWPIQMSQKSTDMVKNGFLYTGFADMTVCYNCGAKIKTWENREIIEETHLKKNKDCEIAKQRIRTLAKRSCGKQAQCNQCACLKNQSDPLY